MTTTESYRDMRRRHHTAVTPYVFVADTTALQQQEQTNHAEVVAACADYDFAYRAFTCEFFGVTDPTLYCDSGIQRLITLSSADVPNGDALVGKTLDELGFSSVAQTAFYDAYADCCAACVQ